MKLFCKLSFFLVSFHRILVCLVSFYCLRCHSGTLSFRWVALGWVSLWSMLRRQISHIFMNTNELIMQGTVDLNSISTSLLTTLWLTLAFSDLGFNATIRKNSKCISAFLHFILLLRELKDTKHWIYWKMLKAVISWCLNQTREHYMKNTYCLFQIKFITEYTNVQHIIITQI